MEYVTGKVGIQPAPKNNVLILQRFVQPYTEADAVELRPQDRCKR